MQNRLIAAKISNLLAKCSYFLPHFFIFLPKNCSFFDKTVLFFAQIELYLYSNKVIENILVFCLMEQSGLIQSDCKILGVMDIFLREARQKKFENHCPNLIDFFSSFFRKPLCIPRHIVAGKSQ